MTDVPSIHAVGDAAMCVRLSAEMSDTAHERVKRYLAFLQSSNCPGVMGWAPSYASVMVYYHPLQISASKLFDWLAKGLDDARYRMEIAVRRIEVPVIYGGDNGPDLAFVAASTGLSEAEVVACHSAAVYRVDSIGFAPGFPYLSGLHASLSMPRRDSPRRRVPAGSVAIAGRQAGIYPRPTAGGWQIIGRTPTELFDISADEPCLFHFGDEVVFRPVENWLEGVDGG